MNTEKKVGRPKGSSHTDYDVSITGRFGHSGCPIATVILSTKLDDVINSKAIVFDELTLTIRTATELDSKIIKVSKGRSFTLTPKYHKDETLFGNYYAEVIGENHIALTKTPSNE